MHSQRPRARYDGVKSWNADFLDDDSFFLLFSFLFLIYKFLQLRFELYGLGFF